MRRAPCRRRSPEQPQTSKAARQTYLRVVVVVVACTDRHGHTGAPGADISRSPGARARQDARGLISAGGNRPLPRQVADEEKLQFDKRLNAIAYSLVNVWTMVKSLFVSV